MIYEKLLIKEKTARTAVFSFIIILLFYRFKMMAATASGHKHWPDISY